MSCLEDSREFSVIQDSFLCFLIALTEDSRFREGQCDGAFRHLNFTFLILIILRVSMRDSPDASRHIIEYIYKCIYLIHLYHDGPKATRIEGVRRIRRERCGKAQLVRGVKCATIMRN